MTLLLLLLLVLHDGVTVPCTSVSGYQPTCVGSEAVKTRSHWYNL